MTTDTPPQPATMNPREIADARKALGRMWRIGRDLHCSELGRAVRLGGRDPGESIRDYERGRTKISGPISAAIQMMLNGALPPDGLGIIDRGTKIGD